MRGSWAAWRLDLMTWGWIFHLLFFAVWEAIALRIDPASAPLTAHLRPVFLNHPLLWFLAFGLWLWLFEHFLLPVPFSMTPK